LAVKACISAKLHHFSWRHFYNKIIQASELMSKMQFYFIHIAHINIFAQIY